MKATALDGSQGKLCQVKVVDLERGRVLFVSDIHDKHEAFECFVTRFRNRVDNGEEVSLVVGGDSEKRETFDCLRDLREHYGDRVVLLVGNYECAMIMGFLSVGRYKSENEIEPVFANMAVGLGERVESYVDFFKSMAFMARTKNGIVFTHAGGSLKVKSTVEVGQFDWCAYEDRYKGNGYDQFLETPLGDFLWSQDLRKRSTRRFLEAMSDERVEAVISVSGHAHISYLRPKLTRDGVGRIGKQILISNFFNDNVPGVYYYLEIDTDRPYRDIDDFLLGREIRHFVL